MARTVSWDALRELATFRAEKGCAISLYIDLDPSVAPTAGDAATRVNALVSEGERIVDARAASLTHDQKRALKADLARIESYFENEFDRDGTRALAIFASALDNMWAALALTEAVRDEIKVGTSFHLAPLVPLVGRGDGAIVAVVSREQGRLYRLRGGRLVELEDLTEEQPRRHDQGGWSQANYQRHIDNMAAQHIEDVAEELERQLKRAKGTRAVVVSTEELRAEFENQLSRETRGAVIGWTAAKAHATPTELLREIKPVLERWRVEQERQLVERWRQEAGKSARATAGWEQTLEAASDARVEVLLYANGVQRKAWQCPRCGRVAANAGSCPLDGTQMEENADGLDLAVHQVLAHGGTVWALQHRSDLDPVEGIGALLRF